MISDMTNRMDQNENTVSKVAAMLKSETKSIKMNSNKILKKVEEEAKTIEMAILKLQLQIDNVEQTMPSASQIVHSPREDEFTKKLTSLGQTTKNLEDQINQIKNETHEKRITELEKSITSYAKQSFV